MAAVPTWVGLGTWTEAIDTTPTADIHASTALGDTVVLCVETANEAFSTPSGWTSAYTPTGTGAAGVAGSVRLYVFYRVYDATWSTISIHDAGDHSFAITFTVSGAAWRFSTVAATSLDTASTTAISCPTGSTSDDNCLVVNIVATAHDSAVADRVTSWTNANLTSITERLDKQSANNAGGGIWICTGTLATAGAIGTTTATATGAWKHEYLTIAIVPGTTLMVSTDNCLLPDAAANERDLLAYDAMMTPDGTQENEDKISLDWVLLADLVLKQIDKALIDSMFTPDDVVKETDKPALDSMFTSDAATKDMDKLDIDAMFAVDSALKVLDKNAATSMFLADIITRETENITSDAVLMDDAKTSSMEKLIAVQFLVADVLNALRDVVASDGITATDAATIQRLSSNIAAIVWARLSAIDLLGAVISANDEFLGDATDATDDFIGMQTGTMYSGEAA